MLIDCDRCEMRDIACGDCVVTALIADRNAAEMGRPAPDADAEQHARNAARSPGGDRLVRPDQPDRPDRPGQAHEADGADSPGPDIGEPERRALRTLAAAGLIPPLRLVLPEAERAATRGDVADDFRDAEAS